MVAAATQLRECVRSRPWLAAAAAAGAAGLVAAALVAVASPAAERGRGGSRTNVATVERGDLIVRETVRGTLGYGAERAVVNRLQGTMTWLPEPGSVVRRGERLYDVDGEPGAYLMYGGTPAWRRLDIGSSDGVDVRQLEQNLVALGYDPNGDVTVDDDFTAATARMVGRWQKAQGLPQTGSVELGRVVFESGPRRIASLSATEGGPATPGSPVLTTTGTARVVTIPLDAAKRQYVSVGDRVVVELPGGGTAQGRVSSISRVARETEEDTVVDVQVTLSKRARVPDLDQAPVSVHIVKRTEKDVVRVPVTALVATRGGGYAVEVARPDGRRALVPVVPGTYADGYVEIERGRLEEGDKVVVAE